MCVCVSMATTEGEKKVIKLKENFIADCAIRLLQKYFRLIGKDPAELKSEEYKKR